MGVEVVRKTFAVLEALAAASAPTPLNTLTARVKLPKPTVYRILRSLEELGYAAQEGGGGSWLTTARLASLGRGSERNDLKRRVAGHLERLHRQFNETVNLGVLDGADVRYLHVLETTQPLRLMVRPDAVDPFYCTSLGRAIVAHLPDIERDALIERAEFKPVTENTVRSKAALRRILDEVRRNGYAVDDEENDVGVICLGAPIMEAGLPVGAISLSLPKTRLTPSRRKEIIAALTILDLDT